MSSILAGSLLVGGAFAAYAVTDNADPFGINVTPGNLDEDDTTYVTLSWGGSTSLDGVGNITVGENRRVGVVSLKATENYLGKFSLSIKDVTTETKGATDPYLLDYLNVKIYEGNLSLKENGDLPDVPAETTVYTIDSDPADPEGKGGKKSVSFDATGTAAGKDLTIFVNVDSSLSALNYEKMLKDKVRLEVDWGAQAGDEATDSVVYFVKPNTSAWPTVYAYAWNDQNQVNNKWPGVEMVQHNSNVYKISIPTGYNNIVFNNGRDGTEEVKTPDLTIPAASANTPCYDATLATPNWTAVPAAKDYYLVGIIGEATEWSTLNPIKLNASTTTQGEYYIDGLSLKSGNQLKVAYFDGTSTVKDTDYCWAGENADITIEGEYSIYFSPVEKDEWATGSKYGNQFGVEKHLWVVPPAGEAGGDIPEDDQLELTVTLHGYAADNAACFVHYWGTGIEGDALIKNGKATINKNFTGLQVVRMPAGSTAVDYATAWNHTGDIDKDGTKVNLVESDSEFGSFSWVE